MNIALIGPTGAGKGTQAAKLAAAFNLHHVSTGNLFRESLEKQTALGLLAKRYMNQGQLVPDEVVDAMIEEWLRKAGPEENILFDGFPRTRYQAEFLDELFDELGCRLEAVVYLQVSDEEIMRRLSGRLVCSQCQTPYHQTFKPPAQKGVCDVCGGDLYPSDDGDMEVVRSRLRTFRRVTQSLVYYYQKTDRLITVDGRGDIERVYNTVAGAINALPAHPSLDVVLLGPPGSGKGTQADELSARLNLQHVATGDLFRENFKNQTELGKLAKSYMDRGDLVPDDVTVAIARERISRPDTRHGVVLDGFPRNLVQAEALTAMLNDMQRHLAGVLYIKVSDEEIVKRLSGRVICRECQTPFHTEYNPFKTCPYNKCRGEHLYRRDDDKPETVRARLKTYRAQTAPLVEYYRAAGLLVEIDGQGSVSQVVDRMLAAIDNLKQAQARR